MDKKENKASLTRILYVSMVLILCAVAIVVAITSSVNRARREAAKMTDADQTTASPESTNTPQTRPVPDTTASKPTGLDDPAMTQGEDNTQPSLVTPGDGNFENNTPSSTLPTFYVPLNGVVSKSHDPDVAVYSATMGDWRVHMGIDIACSIGDAVQASANGTVSQIWTDPLMGKCVAIAHDGTAVSIYKNLAPDLPENIVVGASLLAGEYIGAVGESALVEIADEPHLHFEMTVGGIHVDPMEYFTPTSTATSLNTEIYE